MQDQEHMQKKIEAAIRELQQLDALRAGIRAVSPCMESALFFTLPHFLKKDRTHFAAKCSSQTVEQGRVQLTDR
jgi:hypothetical protein